MPHRAFPLAGFMLAIGLWLAPSVAQGQSDALLLDGQVFSGVIGPAEAPDLADRLYFRDGHFWSQICTECGFMPGLYAARQTDQGVVFSGQLSSDSRGVFEYQGLVRPDGAIRVNISWKRKRWYWTAQREIIFLGHMDTPTSPLHDLQTTLRQIEQGNPDANPRCARF